jgi:hypothetical protein
MLRAIFPGSPARRKGSEKFFGLFLRAGKVRKIFSVFSCAQERFGKFFWPFPARRKGSEKFFGSFLPAGKVQKSFLAFSCAQESLKRIDWDCMKIIRV